MEEVEAANRAAVESCHGILNSLLCKPKNEKNLEVETHEAVLKFKRVVSLLSTHGGRTKRIRKLENKNKLDTSLPQTLFLDGPNYRSHIPSKPSQILPPPFHGEPVNQNHHVVLGNPVLDMNVKLVPPPLPKPRPLLHQLHRIQVPHQQFSGMNLAFDKCSLTSSMSFPAASYMSCLSMDGSASANVHHGSPFQFVGGPPPPPSRMPQTWMPRPIQHQQQKRMCTGGEESISVKCGNGDKCHYPKKRRLRVRKSFKVPAGGNQNVANIPGDEYSWRKYGQKPIKGSPYPRGYYKCSSMRGCPARKHVEKCVEDPSMLMVTYECEHKH